LVLSIFVVLMWAVMLFVFGGVVNSIPDLRTKCIVGGSGIALVAFSTSAMIAVYIHLKKNGNFLLKIWTIFYTKISLKKLLLY